MLLLEVVLEGLVLWSVESRMLTEHGILMRLKQPWSGLSAQLLRKACVLVHVCRDKGLNLLLQYVTPRYWFLPMSEQT